MLYSKNGSIPGSQTDGTEGWIEVEDPPEVPEGKELVWWYPPGWVIRDPIPVKDGFAYSWSQSEERWVEYVAPITETYIVLTQETIINPEIVSVQDASLQAAQIVALSSSDISSLG